MLVLDGEERAALAVVRSLVRAGHRVLVGAHSRWSLAGVSRGAESVRLVEPPLARPEAFAHEVAAVVAATGASILIPITDASLEAVLAHRASLPPGTILPFAALETYRRASDKVLVNELAKTLGIGIEDSVTVHAGDGAPSDRRLFPGVVKPHRSIVGGTVRAKTGVQLVDSAEECETALAALPEEAFPALVQRRVRGAGEGIFLARWDGRSIARFAHRRLREKPPSGGVSVFRESIEADARVLTACERLLDRLDWQGVAMIEGKRDDADGSWRIMEINGRFWGSLQLAIDAGVDFPARLVSAALGRDPGESPPWRAGVRLRWEWGEMDHLLVRLLRSRERLRLPSGAPGRVASVLSMLKVDPRHDRLEVLRLRDPLPFAVESLARMGVRR